jgi:hypothetical protein
MRKGTVDTIAMYGRYAYHAQSSQQHIMVVPCTHGCCVQALGCTVVHREQGTAWLLFLYGYTQGLEPSYKPTNTDSSKILLVFGPLRASCMHLKSQVAMVCFLLLTCRRVWL